MPASSNVVVISPLRLGEVGTGKDRRRRDGTVGIEQGHCDHTSHPDYSHNRHHCESTAQLRPAGLSRRRAAGAGLGEIAAAFPGFALLFGAFVANTCIDDHSR